MRPLLTFLAAWVAGATLIDLLAPAQAPFWTALVGGLGAGFLAATVVAMEEGVVEDALKGGIFGFLGGALLVMGMPGWVAWPLVVGPWVGFLGNRRRGREAPPPPS